MDSQDISEQIKFHIDALAKLGVKIKQQKKRTYNLTEKGTAWRELVNEVKSRPENAKKNMREILKIASAEKSGKVEVKEDSVE
jgi:hypothetical protein